MLDPDCSFSAGTFTCTTSAAIAPGGSVSYQLTLDVPAGYASATLVNTATITSTPIAETDPSDNADTDTDGVVLQGDIGDHEDRRRRLGRGRHVDDVHDHGDEQRPVADPGRRGALRPDPGRDRGRASRSRTVRSRRTTFTCTTSAPIAVGGTGHVSADARRGARTTRCPRSRTPSPSHRRRRSTRTPRTTARRDTDTVTTSADLAMTKTDGVASIIGGHVHHLHHHGHEQRSVHRARRRRALRPDPRRDDGSSESEPDCSIAAGTFTCTTSAPIAPGGSLSYQLTLAVPPASVIVTVVNTVSITSAPVPDPDARTTARPTRTR